MVVIPKLLPKVSDIIIDKNTKNIRFKSIKKHRDEIIQTTTLDTIYIYIYIYMYQQKLAKMATVKRTELIQTNVTQKTYKLIINYKDVIVQQHTF